VDAELARIDHRIRPLDIVLIWTGCDRFFDQPDWNMRHPGMSREATLVLIDKGVRTYESFNRGVAPMAPMEIWALPAFARGAGATIERPPLRVREVQCRTRRSGAVSSRAPAAGLDSSHSGGPRRVRRSCTPSSARRASLTPSGSSRRKLAPRAGRNSP
jgi:hypothetical protein